MTLIDDTKGIAYLPISLTLLEEMKDWSRPIQVRWEAEFETLEIRDMKQPVKGVYITAEDAEEMLP
jgi:hypothetical protein